MLGEARPAIISTLAVTVVTGLAFPALVGLVSRAAFPFQAEGSLLRRDGRVVGSLQVGQAFTAPGDFWGRPSATVALDGSPRPCDASRSGGSNLAPGDPELGRVVRARLAALEAADPGNPSPVPADLVTASGSGLDPHISPEAAEYQVRRVARARGLGEGEVRRRVREATEGPQWGFLGESRVNVLRLNLALDAARP